MASSSSTSTITTTHRGSASLTSSPSSNSTSSASGSASGTFNPPPPVRPTNGSGFNGTNGGGGGGGSNQSQGTNDGPFNQNTNASLYLYTFLATLILLLAVSSAIIIRSFLLRRRARRMIEEAIANGTWVPPTSSTRKPIGKRPEMLDVYLGDSNAYAAKFEKHWDSLQPLGALPTIVTPPSYRSPPPTSAQAVTMRSLLPFIPPRHRSSSSPAQDVELEPMEISPEPVQLGFLIAMPSKAHLGHGNEDDEGLEGVVLEVGVCRNDIVPPASEDHPPSVKADV